MLAHGGHCEALRAHCGGTAGALWQALRLRCASCELRGLVAVWGARGRTAGALRGHCGGAAGALWQALHLRYVNYELWGFVAVLAEA